MLFNYIFYKYYVDKTDSYSLATITVVIAMSIGLICVLLIPIDIFMTTSKDAEKLSGIYKVDTNYFKTIMTSM
jgi:hypothetical protein